MKAWDMIKALLGGYIEIEQAGFTGTESDFNSRWLDNYFGIADILRGQFEINTKYVYLYNPDENGGDHLPKPDVVIKDNVDQIIYLWKIED